MVYIQKISQENKNATCCFSITTRKANGCEFRKILIIRPTRETAKQYRTLLQMHQMKLDEGKRQLTEGPKESSNRPP